ncbi:unnamed protein product [Dovyalis caffra]|uniref:Uncharacterized protein n=1 Tax=Dovyalis caffra TaxID=77055 RepID=A0AAV1SRW2_9ROSI|nr:unnamed protein product [Dovyalis caffra]
MLKLSRFLNSNRNPLDKSSDFRDGLALHALTFQAGFSTGGQSSAVQDRIFAPYSVFKGKAALSVEPVLPTFLKFGSGNFRVDRRGSMMLTFLPAVGERKYDYEKRQKFALSATELGSLISMGPKDSSEFFHDPSMLSSYAIASIVIPSISNQLNFATAMLAKSLMGTLLLDETIMGWETKDDNMQALRSSLLGDSEEGSNDAKSENFSPPLVFFCTHHDNLMLIVPCVVNNILKTNERFTVPVTTAEFTVLKTACSSLLYIFFLLSCELLDTVGQLKLPGRSLLEKLAFSDVALNVGTCPLDEVCIAPHLGLESVDYATAWNHSVKAIKSGSANA